MGLLFENMEWNKSKNESTLHTVPRIFVLKILVIVKKNPLCLQTETYDNDEWVSDCCLTPSEQSFSYIMTRTNYIWWDNIRFVLDQHAYIVSSLKQQSTGRHVTPLGHVILIQSQPVFVLTA